MVVPVLATARQRLGWRMLQRALAGTTRFPQHNNYTTSLDSPITRWQQQRPEGVSSSLLRRTMVVVTKTSSESLAESTASVQPVLNDSSPSSPEDINEFDNDVNITASCWERIRSLIEGRHSSPDELYLRLYVDAGGCSGFQYKFEITLDEDEAVDVDDDVVFSQDDGLRLVVDKTSLGVLKGSTVDFVQEMIKSAFVVVNNPQSESACGCGSSFAVKNFESNPALD